MYYLLTSTFNKKVYWKNCIPIEAGSQRRDTHIYETRDNVGDNISDLNPWFGELTVLYWIWKNFSYTNDDIIGFAHWNKRLKISESNVKKIIESDSKKWVISEGFSLVKHDYPSDIVTLGEVLKKSYPDYYKSFQRLYNSDGSTLKNRNNCTGQMFFTSGEQFKKYCDFLFAVLFDVFEKVGKVDRPAYHKRYLAFLGERLLAVYLDCNSIPCIEVKSLYANSGIFMRILKKLFPSVRKKYECSSSYID